MSDAAVPSTEQVQSYLAQHSLEAVIEDAVNEAVLRLAKARASERTAAPSPHRRWHERAAPHRTRLSSSATSCCRRALSSPAKVHATRGFRGRVGLRALALVV